MPVRAALPVSIGIFPGFLRGDRKAYDERATEEPLRSGHIPRWLSIESTSCRRDSMARYK